MKEFFRDPVYTSPASQKLWTPRLKVATALWSALERGSVAVSYRPSALLTVSGVEVPELSYWARENGLFTTVLGTTTLPRSYSAGVVSQGTPGFRVVIHHQGMETAWFDAWKNDDIEAIGKLLGYPKCCRDYFAATWGKKSKDGTLQMSGDGNGPVNIYLRWLGVRLIPHLPCSSHCKGSLIFQENMKSLAHSLGLDWQLRIVERILDWPLMYTALHGILEVTTPALKFSASTDYTSKLQGFRRKGVYDDTPESYEDNGFASPDIMKICHETVAGAVMNGWGPFLRVVDLGCGDGALLRYLVGGFGLPAFRAFGVEIEEEKIQRGKMWWPDTPEMAAGRVEDFEPSEGDLCVIMAGRRPKRLPPRFVVYGYGDWLRGVTGEAGLKALCAQQGLPEPENIVAHPNVPVSAGWVTLKEEDHGGA